MTDIQQATLDDLNEFADLFNSYRLFYGKASDVQAGKEFLKARIEGGESVIFLARETGNTAVGFTQLYPLFSSTRLKRFWLLNDLFVHPDHRGKGISVALIDRAKQLCHDTGACGMYLETEKTNMIGNILYPKTDFKLMDKVNFYTWDAR